MTSSPPAVAIVGAGPAGLIAAEHLSARGVAVTVFDRMSAPGRKFLVAGRGGLNLTRVEPMERFCARYGDAAAWVAPYLRAFPPEALRAWADGLGAETFVGTSNRVFPKAMKATPLLRAWSGRLIGQGVEFRMRHNWLGWNDAGAPVFEYAGRPVAFDAAACLIALGGASWPRLGTNGDWAGILEACGVAIVPMEPANCGFYCRWSDHFSAFAGEPLKNIALTAGGEISRGEAVVTEHGIEGGGVYELSRILRETIKRDGKAELTVDLRPNLTEAAVTEKLSAGKRGQSQSNRLRKALHLGPVAINLIREVHGVQLPTRASDLAACVKHIPLTLTGTAPLARAISTAGGIARCELDEDLQLRRLPGVFVAGEMLDWEAPTGGYLLSACFATGLAAARGILRRLGLDG